MFYSKRVERAFERSRKAREEREAQAPVERETPLEKGDLFAMIVSGLGVILPVAIAVLLLLCAVGYFFVFR